MTVPTPAASAATVVPPDRQYFVGVEVGPVVTHACVFTAELEPVGKAKVSTKKDRGAMAVVERIGRCVEYAIDECDLHVDQIRAVAVGVPGEVVPAAGVVSAAESLGWKHVPLKAALEKLLRRPVFVENYFRLSALGVYTREVHTQPHRFAALFLGPEIGGAVMVDGHLPTDGPPLARDEFKVAADGILAIMPQAEFRHLRTRELRKAVRKGNPAVLDFARAIARRVGEIAAELIRQFRPDLILLGGGLIDEMSDEILGIVEAVIRASQPDSDDLQALLGASALGDLAGMTGAAALAIQSLQRPASDRLPVEQSAETQYLALAASSFVNPA